MKQDTRDFLEHLASVKNNSKAIDIINYINELESILSSLTKDNIE